MCFVWLRMYIFVLLIGFLIGIDSVFFFNLLIGWYVVKIVFLDGLYMWRSLFFLIVCKVFFICLIEVCFLLNIILCSVDKYVGFKFISRWNKVVVIIRMLMFFCLIIWDRWVIFKMVFFGISISLVLFNKELNILNINVLNM